MAEPRKIAYLGPEGTFTEMAARQLPGDNVLAPVASVTDALDAVLHGEADRAVVPIENSIEGGVSARFASCLVSKPTINARHFSLWHYCLSLGECRSEFVYLF